MDKWLHPFLPQKDEHKITKINRSKTLIVVDAKVYNTMFHNHIRSEVEKIIDKVRA